MPCSKNSLTKRYILLRYPSLFILPIISVIRFLYRSFCSVVLSTFLFICNILPSISHSKTVLSRLLPKRPQSEMRLPQSGSGLSRSQEGRLCFSLLPRVLQAAFPTIPFSICIPALCSSYYVSIHRFCSEFYR